MHLSRFRETSWHTGAGTMRPAVPSWVALVLALLLGSHVYAADLAAIESQRIDYLIHSVEALQGASFLRNGQSYDAKAAGSHLRLKLRMAGSHVATAEDFIRLCASVSSMSGMPYQIKFADGHMVSSEAWLKGKLEDFDKANQVPTRVMSTHP